LSQKCGKNFLKNPVSKHIIAPQTEKLRIFRAITGNKAAGGLQTPQALSGG
jgi:hypothetical protein